MSRKIYTRSLLILFACISLVFLADYGSSSEVSKKPYSQKEVYRLGQQRSFKGPYLTEIAFPLGGIGTGTVSLGGRGNLRDWEIFNRPAKGKNLPFPSQERERERRISYEAFCIHKWTLCSNHTIVLLLKGRKLMCPIS